MQNHKIYLINSNSTEKYYIGSTKTMLYQRFANHKLDYKNYQNKKANFGKHREIYDILKYADVSITLLENYECDDKEQLKEKINEIKEQYKNNSYIVPPKKISSII
jgi:hypothetical protein